MPEPCVRDAAVEHSEEHRGSQWLFGLKTGSLTHNFVWTLAGNVFFAACQWIVLILLAKLGSTEMVGQFALAMAVAFPITLIANLQLRVVYVTDLEGKYPLDEVLGLRLILSMLAWAIMLLACGIAGYNAKTTTIVLIVGTAQLIDCVSETYYGICQRYERMDRIARSLMLRSSLALAVLTVIILATRNLIWGVAGYVVGRVAVLLGYDASLGTFRLADGDARLSGKVGFSLLERLRPRWNFRNQREMLWVALPLGGVGILVALTGNIPRYAIEHYLGPRELGIYSALNTLPLAGSMIATALGYAAFARLARLFYTGDLQGFRALVAKVLGICAGLGGVGILASAVVGRQALEILYRPEYAERSALLVCLAAVAAIAYLAAFLGCAMTAAAQFRAQVPLFLVVTAVSIGCCVLFVPKYGLYGAALAGSISITVQALGTAAIIYRAMAMRGRAQRPAATELAHGAGPAFEIQS